MKDKCVSKDHLNTGQGRPKYIASCSFGKDSLATILLAKAHGEPLDEAVYTRAEKGYGSFLPSVREMRCSAGLQSAAHSPISEVFVARNRAVHRHCQRRTGAFAAAGKRQADFFAGKI